MIEKVIQWQKDRGLDKMPYKHGFEILNILEEVCETHGMYRVEAEDMYSKLPILDIEIDDILIDCYFDICVYSIGAMLKLGYDPIKVFEEGLKEINDRTGRYNPKLGKWEKRPPKPGAYKADYSKALI